MKTDLTQHDQVVFPGSAPEIAAALFERDRRILLLGSPGTGKSTLAGELALLLLHSGRECRCISADPGTPAFGIPGAVSLARLTEDGWQVIAWEPLCTLDAGRFRLPLVTAVHRLARLAGDGMVLLDSPGVTRGISGRELLAGLVEAGGIDTLLAFTAEGEPPPLANEFSALSAEVFIVRPSSVAKRPGKRYRARTRTRQWDDYLAHASSYNIELDKIRITGTPPPLDESSAWIGRQVALLGGNRAGSMAEVMQLQGNQLTLLAPPNSVMTNTILVRNATRSANGLLETAEPFASGRLAYQAQPEVLAKGEINGGPRIVGRVGALDLALVNGVFGDPLLHLRIRHLGRSMLFDLGDGGRLSARIAHQVSDVFITHAHMDHLGGFQWLLRSRLGEYPACRIYGPPGIAEHIACYINGFLWDRIGGNGPAFEVAELHGRYLKRCRIQAGIPGQEALDNIEVTDGILLDESGFRVRSVQLDHHTPVLSYALELSKTLNVRKDRLKARGLQPGPWLNELKQQILADNRDASVELPDGNSARVAELGDELVQVMPGKKLVYATDLADTPDNRSRLVRLARNAHTLFCEAAFSETDAASAAKNGHLTTRAAGEIATLARVARLVPFHFSRRYQGNPQKLYDELTSACSRVALPSSMKVFESPVNGDGDPAMKLDPPSNNKRDNPIRAVLFDFGGVVAEEGFYEGLRAIAGQQGLDPEILPQLGMEAVYESGYVVGRGSEADFWNLLRRKSGVRGTDSALRNEILPRFRVRPWLVELVRDLRRRGYLVALLSDQVDWLDLLDAEQDFLKEFDRAYVSYRLGKGKKDPSLFTDVLRDLGLRPDETLFIDDARSNIERARGRGLQVLQYTDRKSVEAVLETLPDKSSA